MIHEKDFGRVGVLCGGTSSEREVSLASGSAVYDALISRGISAELIDTKKQNIIKVSENRIERAIIMLHGRGGEDGAIQGLLEALDIPYTGSGIAACALALDKWRSKLIFEACNIPTPQFSSVTSVQEVTDVVNNLGVPLIVKPSREGSTIGLTKILDQSEAQPAYELARQYDCSVIAEKFIEGDELTVAILNGKPLPVVRIVAPNNNYDYQAKYHSDETEYFCPSELDSSIDMRVQEVAMKAFKVLGCVGWGRVDVMLDKAGIPWVLEVNTVPGMTKHSLVPMAAKATGIDFEELVLAILGGNDVAQL